MDTADRQGEDGNKSRKQGPIRDGRASKHGTPGRVAQKGTGPEGPGIAATVSPQATGAASSLLSSNSSWILLSSSPTSIVTLPPPTRRPNRSSSASALR